MLISHNSCQIDDTFNDVYLPFLVINILLSKCVYTVNMYMTYVNM